jgi:branched-subunit amino acid ABC-type transport system permease component
MWTQAEVTALRERLGVDRPRFARIVGVDTRTVFRWEAGEVQPSGAAGAVLTGLRQKLEADPTTAEQVIAFVVGASAVGGLAYLMVKLLDHATLAPLPLPRPRRRRRR